MRRHTATFAAGFLTLRILASCAAAGDVSTTAIVLAQGGQEQNRALSRGTVPLAIGSNAGIIWGISRLEHRHPRIAQALYITLISGRATVAALNARQIRR
jgi:hypothetical protein